MVSPLRILKTVFFGALLVVPVATGITVSTIEPPTPIVVELTP